MPKGVAAIWARVSTRDQRELSPDSQVAAVRPKLEAEGYVVPDWAVIEVDWTSLDLMASPQFQELRKWIKEKAIQAIGILDRDRLQAQGLQRLVFLSECQEKGVEVITVQGAPMMEGSEGQLVELALALGKERAVMRAQQGARDGLRNRARLRGLPAVPAKPYGYVWDKENPLVLKKGENWDAVAMAWDLALKGQTLRQIAFALTSRGFQTARGRPYWYPTSIWYLLTNPVYAGRYYALRYEATMPKNRQGMTYGKSSRRIRAGTGGDGWDARSANWLWMKEVVVESPVVNWNQFLAVQDRLERNKAMALANATARRFYLLRGLIICQECGSRYYGKNTSGKFVYYMCGRRRKRVKGGPECSNRHLPASAVDRAVWKVISDFLSDPETVMKRRQKHEARTAETEQYLRSQVEALRRRSERLDAEETDLLLAGVRRDEAGALLYSPTAVERARMRYKAQRTWIAEEMERIETRLASMHEEVRITEDLRRTQEQVQGKLHNASLETKRWVLDKLRTRVLCWPDRLVVEIAVGGQVGATVSKTPWTSGAVMRTRPSSESQVTL